MTYLSLPTDITVSTCETVWETLWK